MIKLKVRSNNIIKNILFENSDKNYLQKNINRCRGRGPGWRMSGRGLRGRGRGWAETEARLVSVGLASGSWRHPVSDNSISGNWSHDHVLVQREQRHISGLMCGCWVYPPLTNFREKRIKMSEVFSLWIMMSLVSISSNFPFQVDLNTSPSASLNKEQDPNVLICWRKHWTLYFRCHHS